MHRINKVHSAVLLAILLSSSAGFCAGLDPVLEKTGQQVASFLDQFSDVKCIETVSQEKLSKSGHAQFTENSTYDYFVLLEGSKDELMLNESRLEQEVGKPRQNMPMLLTNGFSMLFLIFHPYYQNSFHFEDEAPETIEGRSYYRLHFTHIPGTRTPAALAVRGREYPLELQGTAWIDPKTGMIARIEAALEKDMRDVGLVSLGVNVDYEPVSLPGWSETYRLPVTATVDVESLRQRWRNVHHFSKYQRFMVDTQQAINDKGLKK